MKRKLRSRALPALLVLAGAAMLLVAGSGPERESLTSASVLARRQASGGPQLVSVQPMPGLDGQMCEWVPASANMTLAAALQEHATAAANPAGSNAIDRKPLRAIRDTYATYSAIALNMQDNEVYLQDENLFGIKVFNRLDNTPDTAAFTEPKRMIGGHQTKLEFNCGLYIDPKTGDIYSVNNDTTDDVVVFPRNAEGDVAPARELKVPHGAYGIAVDEAKQELYLTVEHINSVVVFNKYAKDTDKPLRIVSGPKTGLEDPHGIGLDNKNQIVYVTNHGNVQFKTNGVVYGKFERPSITSYPMGAEGDVAPIRTIEGPKTELNWPAHIWVDEVHQELFVANDAGDSILVFRTTDNGDVAPIRKIQGPKTQLKNPTGVFLDLKNDEIWASNMGNHRATVYARTANGNVAPKRVIRSAPADKLALAIGNPGAVGYDSKREEILVPNCVAHPQIAIFPRMAGENARPSRLLAGQKTYLSRTMHDVRYDPIHDELYAINPFSNAILVFRGGANGEEAPIRVIQGPKTLLSGNDRLDVDPVHNEILTTKQNKILVFPREAFGDVAPIRVVEGPDTKLNNDGTLAVDPIHNKIVTATDTILRGSDERGRLLIFDRLANGNAKPVGMIAGPKTEIIRINQLQVVPDKGWIVAAQPGFYDMQTPEGIYVGVWSINDNGDVPPRWKLAGPNSVIVKPRGVALNAKHKEMIVADMRLNAVFTYYFPEIF